ncbi:hypothetical protein D3C71_1661300 [compost metagenome]
MPPVLSHLGPIPRGCQQAGHPLLHHFRNTAHPIGTDREPQHTRLRQGQTKHLLTGSGDQQIHPAPQDSRAVRPLAEKVDPLGHPEFDSQHHQHLPLRAAANDQQLSLLPRCNQGSQRAEQQINPFAFDQ